MKRIVGGAAEEVERTTPEAIDLQRTFRRMLDAGDRACVMEVSSHALALRRADGDPLRGRRVHQPHPGPPRLPRRHGGLLRGQAPAVRPGRRRAPERRSSTSTTPTGPARRRAARGRLPAAADLLGRRGRRGPAAPWTSRFDAAGSRFACRTAEGELAVSLPLPGHFNVANALAAIATASAARGRVRRGGGGAGRRRAGARADGADRRGPAVRGARRLRPHAGLARERPAAPRAS